MVLAMTLSYEEGRARDRKSAQKGMQLLYRVRRDQALEAYGRKCVVCENDHQAELSIVPKKGWTWSHLAGLKKPIRGGHEKMRWLEQQNYPDSHTLVCGPTHSACRKALQLLQ